MHESTVMSSTPGNRSSCKRGGVRKRRDDAGFSRVTGIMALRAQQMTATEALSNWLACLMATLSE
jgi:hypothetical protein